MKKKLLIFIVFILSGYFLEEGKAQYTPDQIFGFGKEALLGQDYNTAINWLTQ